MITKFIILIAGTLVGMFTMALAVAAGDAERCEDCIRMREELRMEEEFEKLNAQILSDNSVPESREDEE